MNNKQKAIMILAIVWACFFFTYGMSSMNFTMINHQASQYSSGGFNSISHLATGYFNDTNKQLQHMPKLTP
jgi:hypothetical protein